MKLLLFSGGVESTCLAVMHEPDLLLTVDYGQISVNGEKRSASYIAKQLSMRHESIEAPMRALGAGDLANKTATNEGTVSEAWPFRNQMLITLAAMRYEREGLQQIIIGTVLSDAIHTDGSQEFISSISHTLKTQNSNITVQAPAITISTYDLVKASGVSRDLLGGPFRATGHLLHVGNAEAATKQSNCSTV